ncbi:MAG: polysaccharide deacetylase family protein [Sporomusaceae bacterium]|nr:polysaccharide deacetylase family protein [Sporomusaceae bacterium]
MFDANWRLTSLLGLLTAAAVFCLLLDYFRLLKRPARIGLWLALVCIAAGFGLTLQAVLPGNHFYGPVFSEVATAEKVVALTFDDGPYPPYTEQLLDVLGEANVTATFFMLGQNAEQHPELVARVAAAGHQIGNHTYSHVDLLKLSRDRIADEIDRTQRVLTAITGSTPVLMRPPHGFRDAVVMEVMAERGLKVVEWSVVSRDWLNPGVETIVGRTLDGVKNGSIVLLHDGDSIANTASRAQTVEAARRIIRELKSRGYRFVTVGEILQAPAAEGAN